MIRTTNGCTSICGICRLSDARSSRYDSTRGENSSVRSRRSGSLGRLVAMASRLLVIGLRGFRGFGGSALGCRGGRLVGCGRSFGRGLGLRFSLLFDHSLLLVLPLFEAKRVEQLALRG